MNIQEQLNMTAKTQRSSYTAFKLTDLNSDYCPTVTQSFQ